MGINAEINMTDVDIIGKCAELCSASNQREDAELEVRAGTNPRADGEFTAVDSIRSQVSGTVEVAAKATLDHTQQFNT